MFFVEIAPLFKPEYWDLGLWKNKRKKTGMFERKHEATIIFYVT